MIYGNIKDFLSLSALPEVDKKAIYDFLTKDKSTLEKGKHDLIDGIYAKVLEYTTDVDGDVFEEHEKYLDLQYVYSGTEFLEVTDEKDCKVKTEYNDVKDIALYTSNTCSARVKLDCLHFVILDVKELHKPNIADGVPSNNKKIVIKIPKVIHG